MTLSHDPPSGGKEPARPRFVRLLRLVHPLPAAAPKPKRARHHGRIFSADEQKLLRASLRTARGLFKSWPCLADAMSVPSNTLQRAAQGHRPVSAAIAVRLCRVLGVPFEALLTPGVRIVRDPCPTCGGAA